MSTERFTYKTIIGEGIGEFRDRGSRFYGFCYPVLSEQEIKAKLKLLKEQHPKANHHCYAWRLGNEDLYYRANDNGEPSGSAGRPILGRIDSASLTDVLVAVIRYFGGILLGVPGLIHAYKTAAEESLKQVEVIEKDIVSYYELNFDYTLMNEVMRLLKSMKIEVTEQKMELFCVFKVAVPLSQQTEFQTRSGDLFGLEVNPCK